MRKLIVWEANDGSLHRRRVDAAARDRELRRKEDDVRAQAAAIRAFTSYVFMIDADTHDDDGNYIKRGRLPPNTDVADGLIMHFWESRKGLSVDEAAARAVARCRALRQRWRNLDWFIDYEAKVVVFGKEAGTVDLNDVAAVAAADLLR